jgi:hypothetical protein
VTANTLPPTIDQLEQLAQAWFETPSVSKADGLAAAVLAYAAFHKRMVADAMAVFEAEQTAGAERLLQAVRDHVGGEDDEPDDQPLPPGVCVLDDDHDCSAWPGWRMRFETIDEQHARECGSGYTYQACRSCH